MPNQFADPVQNPLGALTAMSMAPMQQMLSQQKEGFDRSREQLAKVQQAAERAPAMDEAERWGAMAEAAGKVPPMVGGFGQLLASIGGAYGKTLSAQEQREFEREALIAKLMEQGAGGLGQGSMTALTQAMLNPYMNVPGVGLVRRTDASLTLPSNLIPEYNKLYTAFYKEAVDQKMPNPEQWAEQQARQRLSAASSAPEIAGGRATTPPAKTLSDVTAEMAPVGAATPEGKITKSSADWVKKLQQEEAQAVAQGDYARALEVKQARKALEGQSAEAPPSGLQYRDVPKAEMEKATAEETGKGLAKEFVDLQSAASASSMLKAQLGTLRELYNTPNLPEGALGEKLQGIRSGLSTLGIEVGKEVGAGDMINAIGGKLALLTRTAEGGNLMPGAMSDFEQKILRSLAPGLQQTAEGRSALVDYLSDMADVRIRLASEATKLAEANRGILPASWYSRRARVLKEEQARLTLKARELSNRFKGSK